MIDPFSEQSPLLAGADAHLFLNNGYSAGDVFDALPEVGAPEESWDVTLANAPANLTKFATVSVMSGINSFYNTGVAIANIFGADAKENETGSWISSIDTDLGMYYRNHQQGADLLGFIATSFIPGTAGVKIANGMFKVTKAAEAGFIGKNLTQATGLLAPKVNKFLGMAAEEIALGKQSFTIFNANVGKAITAQAGREFFDAAIFEAAVQATMFKNPVLEDQSFTDIATNILTGGLLGTAVFGAGKALRFKGEVNKAVGAVDELSNEVKLITPASEGLTDAEKVLHYSDQLASIRGRSEVVIAQAKLDKTLDEALINKLKVEEQAALGEVLLDVRKNVNKISKNQKVSNALVDGVKDSDALQYFNMNLAGLKEVKLAGDVSGEFIKDELGKVFGKKGVQKRFVDLKSGEVMLEAPKFLSLADTVEDVLKEAKKLGLEGKKIIPFSLESGTLAAKRAEARFILAKNLEPPKGTGEVIVDALDIPLQEAAHRWLVEGKISSYKIRTTKESVRIREKESIYGGMQKVRERSKVFDDLLVTAVDPSLEAIRTSKADLAVRLMDLYRGKFQKGGKIPADIAAEISAQTGMSKEFIVGMDVAQEVENLHIFESMGKDFTKPSYAKLVFEEFPLGDGTGNLGSGNYADSLAWVKSKQKKYETDCKTVSESIMREFSLDDIIPDVEDSLVVSTANRIGVSPSLAGATNAKYNTVGAHMELTGKVHQGLSEGFAAKIGQAINPFTQRLAVDAETSILWSKFNWDMATSAEGMLVKEVDGKLITISKRDFDTASKQAAKLAEASEIDPADIPLSELDLLSFPSTKEVPSALRELVKTHVKQTDYYNQTTGALLTAREGAVSSHTLDQFIPVRPDFTKQPYYAIVVDNTIPQGLPGRTRMIAANTDADLLTRINAAKQNGLDVWTKSDTKKFHEAYLDFSFEEQLLDAGYDASKTSQGKAAAWEFATDPEVIAQQFAEFHAKKGKFMADEVIKTRLAKTFGQLERLDSEFEAVGRSALGRAGVQAADESTPYKSYQKVALNRVQADLSPLMLKVNGLAEATFDKVLAPLKDVWTKDLDVSAKVEEVTRVMQRHGIKTSYDITSQEMFKLINHSVPQNHLQSFIRTVNSVLGSTILQLDPMNALVNTTASTINRLGEGNHLISQLKELNLMPGAFTELPGSGGAKVFNVGKLQSIALSNVIGKRANPVVGDISKKLKWDMTSLEAVDEMLDAATFSGVESVKKLTEKTHKMVVAARKFSEVGSKVTGNAYAESLTRQVSVEMAALVCDPLVKAGKMSKQEMFSVINSFVNKTQGNISVAQRPLAFFGPVGQAIGLFQTYQFNIMQQLFKYVANGDRKSSAILMGMQGSIFGMNGLPGFQALNEHIVANLSGNEDHFDLYDTTRAIAGHGALGDLLLYGAPSTLLGANFYSRGDLSPRNPAILPTALSEVPAISMYSKAFGNVFNTVGRIQNGANVQDALLQGIEHNALNRPLSGLAVVAQGFSTDSRGKLIAQHGELASWATAVRLAGAKPLDEALARDATYRLTRYAAEDKARLDALGEAVKVSMVGKEKDEALSFDENHLEQILSDYVAYGGDQKRFNQWMVSKYKTANTSTAEKISKDLKSPYSQRMQMYLGGEE